MSERVAAGLLCESGPGDRVPNRPLDQRLVDVMAALLAGLGVPPSIDLGKGPLPAPVGGRAGILAVQGIRHRSPLISASTPLTSSRAMTTGTRRGLRARIRSPRSPTSRPMTRRDRNSRGARAWFWVEALTLSLPARYVRKALICGSAISDGCRAP